MRCISAAAVAHIISDIEATVAVSSAVLRSTRAQALLVPAFLCCRSVPDSPHTVHNAVTGNNE